MKSKGRWMIAFVAITGACVNGVLSSQAAQESVTMMNSFEAQQNAETAARAKDASWKPTCKETGSIQIGDSRNPGALENFCLDQAGNMLACMGAPATGAKSAPSIRVYSPKGALLKTLPLTIKPGAICVGKDGSIYVAGDSRILKLNADGKVLATADSPAAKEMVVISKETEDMLKEQAKTTRRPYAEELAQMKKNLEERRKDVTGLAVSDQDVFMAVPAPNDYTFRVYRFNLALQEPKLVVEKLHGCCGQMDIQARDGNLWIPHNSRHSVESHDRDGKELAKFGTDGKVKAGDFGGCCEPKNLRMLSNGDILAAESGPPTCIKRFSAAGKFKEVVALVDNPSGNCVRVTVEMSPDASHYYLLDTTRDAIRIFEAKH